MANILEILNILGSTAKENNLSMPWICGGLPRDRLLNNIDQADDLDITTGDATVHELAKKFAENLSSRGASYKALSDGHAQVQFEGIKIDFSSNYLVPGIEELLKKAGVKKPTPMLMELMSRDFTCNALLMSLDLKDIKDPTGLGINDIKKRRLRTCLPARITLGEDNKRVVRILYLAAKLNFEVDKEIIDWVKQNPSSIANVKPKYLADKLQKALDYDIDKTARLINEMGLWKYIPILPDLIPYASKAGRSV